MKTFTKHILLLTLMLFGVSGAAWADYVPQKYTGPVDIATLQVGDTLAQGFELTGNQNAYFYFTENRAKENGTLLTTGIGYMRYLIDGYGPNGTVNKGSDVYTPVLEDQATDGNAWVVLGVQTSPQYIVTVAGAWIAPDPTIPVRLDDGNWLFQMPGANKQVYVQYTYPREMGNYVVYSTGVDQNKWYTLDDYTEGTVTGESQSSGNIDLPFEFEYNGVAYTQWAYNTDAEIMLGMRQPTERYRPDNDSSLAIVLMGGFSGKIVGGYYVRWQTFGTAPNRVFVIEYHFRNIYDQDGKYYDMQAQLAENGSITIVYGNTNTSSAYRSFWCGLSHTGSISSINEYKFNEPKNAYYYIDRTDHSYLYNERSSKSDWSWPGQYRWYTFSQTFDKCKMVDSLTYTVTPTSIALQWQDNDNAAGVSYNVVCFYDTIRLDPQTHEPVFDHNNGGFVHDTVWVTERTGNVFTSTSATFDNLNPNVMCTFLVRSQCSETNLSEAIKLTVKTPCFPVATAELPYLMRFNEDEWDGEKDYEKTPRCWDKLFQAPADQTLSSYVSEYIRKDYNYNTGNRYLYMENSDNPKASIAILPAFDTALSALSVSFLAEVESSEAAYAKLEVGYITDIDDTATFTAVETFTTANGLVASVGGDNAMINPGEINVEFRGVTADARMAIRLSRIDPNSWSSPRVRIDSVAVEIAYNVDVTVNNDDFGTAAYTKKQLVAMPDSAHYLVRWDNAHGELVGTDNPQAVTVTSDTAFVAVFAAKPTLTLAQTDGGTLEAIVPQGGAIVENVTADMVSTGWQGEFSTKVTEADLQAYDFMAVDKDVAAAWTGAPATGEAHLIYEFETDGRAKTLDFYDGTTSGAPTTSFLSRGYIYNNRETYYFTTGAGTSNVIASSTPNTYYIDYGTPVTVVATPDSAHYLKNFVGGADTNSNVAVNNTFVVTADTTLTANFEAKPTLTLTANDGGTLTLDGMVTELDQMMAHLSDPLAPGTQYSAFLQSDGVLKDNVKTLTDAQAIALAQRIAQTTGNNNILVVASTFEFIGDKYLSYGKPDGNNEGGTATMTNSNAIRTIYYVNTFDLLPETYPTGVAAGTTANTYRVDYGQTVTVIATPAEYYHLGHWANQAGTEVASVTPLTVTVTSDTTLMAVFERNMRILHGVPEGWTVMADSVSVAVSADSAVVPAGSQIMMIPPVPVKPTVKSFEVEKYLHPNEVPLTMEALTDGTIMVTEPKAGMRYAVNGGNKTDMSGTTQIDVTAGDKVAFYGNGTLIASYDGTKIAGGTAEVKVYGNIMSLVDEENFDTAITLTGTRNFRQLFYENYKLKDASGLLLPATTLTERCYQSMFNYCYALTTAPALPATTMESNCYNNMFYDCTGLTTAPALPATTLAEYCYNYMFYGCTGLTTAPELPATTLADYCYSYMFANCTGLTTAPALPATTLADYCYYYMFANDTNLTTAPSILPATTLSPYCYQRMFHGCTRLTTAPKLPATTLANHCYNYMFAGCTSLTTAPELPATTLVPNCYAYMFQNCSNLRSVTCMATSGINSSNSTVKWLSNTAETGIFVANNAAEWPNNASGIPEGWNRTTTISFATASDCGKIVCSAGHLHDAGSQLPEGCTVVGIMAKVNTDGHGLILGNLEGRLEDAYSTINLFYPTVNYGGTTLKRLPGYMLENLPNCATLGNIPTSNWCVASMDDYKAMFMNLGSQSAEQSYDDNVNATITAAGGKAITDGSEYQEWGFWCTSKYDDFHGWFFKKNSWSYADWEQDNTIYSRYLLPVLAF